MGHARAVLTLSSENEQTKILKDTIKRNLSVRSVEKIANSMPSNNKINKDPDTAILERQLSDVLGAKTNIKHSRSGGVININIQAWMSFKVSLKRLVIPRNYLKHNVFSAYKLNPQPY